MDHSVTLGFEFAGVELGYGVTQRQGGSVYGTEDTTVTSGGVLT